MLFNRSLGFDVWVLLKRAVIKVAVLKVRAQGTKVNLIGHFREYIGFEASEAANTLKR